MSECLDPNLAAGLVDGTVDPGARAGALEHVSECDDCRQLIAALAGTDEEDDEPDAIGRYQIRGLRARGGMGRVYEAYDPKLDRLVAIKVVSHEPTGSSDSSHARMVREARALAKLAHPNVVSIFDVGDFGDDIYIAMELVEGVTLREWLREERTPAEIISAFCDAARGLGAAHSSGMVHRDFKPDNVLVGDDGRVRVVDFGLVRATGMLAETDPNAALLSPVEDTTKTGTIIGTPAYMAPEQHAGGSVDHRADQFSLAVALFEALYGERPFAGKNLAEVAAAISSGDLREPPEGTDVDRSVRRTLERALSAEPDDRFDDLEAMIEALTPRSRAQWPIVASAVAAVGLVGVIGFALLRDGGEEPCKPQDAILDSIWSAEIEKAAVSNAKASGHDAHAGALGRIKSRLVSLRDDWSTFQARECEATFVDRAQPEAVYEAKLSCLYDRLERARAISDSLVTELSPAQLDDLVVAAKRLPDVELCKRDEALSVPQPPADIREAVRAVRASISRASELDIAKEGEPARRAEAILVAARETKFEPVIAEALYLLGRIEIEQAKAKRAESILREAVTLAAANDHDTLLAALWIEIIMTLFEQGRFTDAIAIAPVAEAAMVRANSSARLRARGLQSIGEAYWWKPDYPKALAMTKEAAELLEKSYGDDDADLPYALSLIVEALVDMDEDEEALDVAKRSNALAIKAFGENHSQTAWTLAMLGMSQRANGLYKEAIGTLEAARATLGRITGGHPELASIDREIGYCLYNLGRIDESVAAHQSAADIAATAFGDNDYRVSLHLKNVASSELARGNADKAEAALLRALDIRIKSRGPNHPMTGQAYELLANFEYTREQLAKASEWMDKAEAVYRSSGAKAELASLLFDRASAMRERGVRKAESVKLANEAISLLEEIGDIDNATAIRLWLRD